jgi:hypothetical protein
LRRGSRAAFGRPLAALVAPFGARWPACGPVGSPGPLPRSGSAAGARFSSPGPGGPLWAAPPAPGFPVRGSPWGLRPPACGGPPWQTQSGPQCGPPMTQNVYQYPHLFDLTRRKNSAKIGYEKTAKSNRPMCCSRQHGAISLSHAGLFFLQSTPGQTSPTPGDYRQNNTKKKKTQGNYSCIQNTPNLPAPSSPTARFFCLLP